MNTLNQIAVIEAVFENIGVKHKVLDIGAIDRGACKAFTFGRGQQL